MSASEVVRARIDAKTKTEAVAVLDGMGLSLSEAFRMFLTRIARDKTLPAEAWAPNARTLAAMREARDGDLSAFTTVEALMRDLDADD